jgi:hypothetical protein
MHRANRPRFALLFAALVATWALASDAGAQTAQVRTADTYGMAGCGLGSMIFGADPGFVQIFAATTNGISGSQTFGITTGTSNCVDSSEPVVQVSSFVETNRSVLAKDIARGSGETVSTLSSLAGCRDAAAVGRLLQSRFGAVFTAAATDVEVSTRMIAELRDHPQLGCRALGAAKPAKPEPIARRWVSSDFVGHHLDHHWAQPLAAGLPAGRLPASPLRGYAVQPPGYAASPNAPSWQHGPRFAR